MERPKGYATTIRENGLAGGKPWSPGTRKWAVTLINRNTGKTLSFQYHTGEAIKEKPTFKDVVEAVISDAAFYNEYPSIDEFARESGLDPETDKKELKQAYKTCKAYAEKLAELLGDDYEAMAEYVAE